MSIEVLKGGLLNTVQDAGRFGYQKEGILVSGAMDLQAMRIANLLVANPKNAAVLEITMAGPTLRFTKDMLVAITGAHLSPRINHTPVGLWKPVLVRQGSELTFGAPLQGCRAYLAVAGGIKTDPVLGSRSTYLRASIGGYKGRALQSGDIIDSDAPCDMALQLIDKLSEKKQPLPYITTNWLPASLFLPPYHNAGILRVTKGPEYPIFAAQSQQTFWTTPFVVSPQSDRMGYRLEGSTLHISTPAELLSGAVSFGTIQVPADGNPIVLMADHQTTGGYPRIGTVISTDLPLLAQCKPGDSIRFKEVTLPEAQQLFIEQEQKMKQLEAILMIRFKNP